MYNLRSALIFYFVLIFFFCSYASDYNHPIRVMTFNIRVNVPSDSLNSWPYRKARAASMIRFHQADIVGIQEALAGQVKDLAAGLPDYDWIGIGRDDGHDQGEFMAIFIKKNASRLSSSLPSGCQRLRRFPVKAGMPPAIVSSPALNSKTI